tara:strand:+ start:1289 stop:1507 length:219 start_codon:yes stop_codon:yes gene_type:complete
MSTVDINKNRERWLKKKFEKLVKEARTADGQWLQEELARQEERHRLKQAGLLDQPTAALLQFPHALEQRESD